MRQLTLLILFLFVASVMVAQTSQVTFGKNRVQYNQDFDEWSRFESDNFITYWYGQGRTIGQSVVQMAEYDFAYIQGMLEHRMNQKVQLIVYADITDVKQSNIGSDEVFTLPGGNLNRLRGSGYVSGSQAKFLGNKAFVYFNGDHTDLRRQVREAVAGVYLENMLYGSNIQEVVQNAVLMNLPDWFKQGLVSYMGQPWNTELDDQLRSLMASGRYDDFFELAEEYPGLAGHSFWFFVARNYGESTVSNLLYLTRINRSVESGFLYVLGSPYETVLYNWKEFYQGRFQQDLAGRPALPGQEVAFKNRRNSPVTQLRLSPDGQNILYVLNEIGKVKVYRQEIATGKRELIYKGGNRNALQATDYNYPLIDWNPSGQEIAVLYEVRDKPKLLLYSLTTGKKLVEELAPGLQRVHSLDYIDPGSMVITATVNGYSNVFTYLPATRQFQAVTNDFYDDLDARAVNVRGRRGIVFASNRTDTLLQSLRLDTILPIANFDLFYYDLQNRSNELVRITNTPFADERLPSAIDTTYFQFVTNESGIHNATAARLEDYIHHYDQVITLTTGEEIRLNADSTLESLDTSLIDTIVIEPIIRERAVLYPQTNLPTNIHAQATAPRAGRQARLYVDGGKPRIFVENLAVGPIVEARPTSFGRFQREGSAQYRRQPQAKTTLTGRRSRTAGALARPLPSNRPTAPPVNLTPDPAELDTIVPPAQDTVETTPQEPKIDLDNYLFQSEFEDDTPPPPLGREPGREPVVTTPRDPLPVPRPVNPSLRGEQVYAQPNEVYRFLPSRITPYRTQFRVDYVRTTADNDPLFEGLNTFAGNPDGFTQQPLGILFKGNVKDLFEDHVIEGGLRIPTSFNGTEYFMIYHNRKKRLDINYAVYRRNRRRDEGNLQFGPRRIDENTLLGQVGVRYPLDVFRSLRATATLRRDRVQSLPTEIRALQSKPARDQRVGLRLEYVFDNTIPVSPNIMWGTRYKVYTDVYKGFNFDLNGNDTNEQTFVPGILGIIGIDFRHYQRLDKWSILALRGAGVTNFGKQQILYYLGGADNELGANFGQAVPVPTEENIAFQALANPLRGFDQNIRNGTTYVLGNAELRIPVFNYFFKRIRSSFIRDFQLVGFFDIGTAWVGEDPYSPDNPANIITYPDPSIDNNSPVSVQVTRFRDPIVYGYGLGARTTLFGYFIRVDYGFGTETAIRGEGKWHFSLGYDF